MFGMEVVQLTDTLGGSLMRQLVDDGSFASFTQTGTTIQVRLTKTGETTLYSNVQGLSTIRLHAISGSGAFK